MNKDFLSMAQASKLCPYEQGYLSLLARRGELKAEKIGRNWYTKINWLNAYIAKKKPGDLIVTKEMQDKMSLEQKKQRKFTRLLVFTIGISLLAFASFNLYGFVSKRIADNERKSINADFSPTEIVKIPNENGNLDVYGVGKMKLGEEQVQK
jgi:hypothetical protein